MFDQCMITRIEIWRLGMTFLSLCRDSSSACWSCHSAPFGNVGMQRHQSVEGVGLVGLTHGVGPWTFSMLSSFSSLSSSASVSFRTWSGIILCRWDTGCTDGSIRSLILMSESLPTPSAKSLGNCLQTFIGVTFADIENDSANCKIPSFCTVSSQRRFTWVNFESVLTTWIVDIVLAFLCMTWVQKLPMTGNVDRDPYA